ncbi:helix-turn-helix domain-containing protein [Methylobacterium brachiatum]
MPSMTEGTAWAPYIPQPYSVVLSFRSACEAANLSVSTMRRLIKAGRGPRILQLSERRLGIRRSDLEMWLAGR